MMRGHLIISGHCASPSTSDPESSHQRCARNGAGSKANPRKDFNPCRCHCHFAEAEQYECDNADCDSGILVETDWENDDVHDVDPDTGEQYPVYVHLDPVTGDAVGEECPG